MRPDRSRITALTEIAALPTEAAASCAGAGAFRNGSYDAIQYADFDLSLDPVNSYEQGASSGAYVARGGETLSQIAAQLFGDSSLSDLRYRA